LGRSCKLKPTSNDVLGRSAQRQAKCILKPRP